MALQLVVTTCCGRNITWVGELFSAHGWAPNYPEEPRLSFFSLLGRAAEVLVYDKGGNESSVLAVYSDLWRGGMVYPDAAKVVALPNAHGREAETIAAHMATRWEQLAEVTTFVQGDVKGEHTFPLLLLRRALVDAASHGDGAANASALLQRLVGRMNSAKSSSIDASLCRPTKVSYAHHSPFTHHSHTQPRHSHALSQPSHITPCRR